MNFLLKKAGPKFTDSIIENKTQILEAIKKLIIIDFFDIFSSKDFAIAIPHTVAEIMNPKYLLKKQNMQILLKNISIFLQDFLMVFLVLNWRHLVIYP